MKVIIATISLLVVLVTAEPPLSRSYLPPPPGRNGYTEDQSFGSGPEIVAARNLDASNANHGGQARTAFGRDYRGGDVHGNGFGRNTQGTPQARFGNQGYGNAGSFGRNALKDVSTESANYNFGYMVKDQEGTEFGHHEERQEERAQGEYHVVLPDGKKQTVNYEADERGFKPQISYQDADPARSGYDNNAQSLRGNVGNNAIGRSGGY